jgi:lysophosphatidate acyltransferase
VTLNNFIFLDRKNRGNALKQASQVVEDMKRLYTSVFIYPEGTRSGGHTIDLFPFKKKPFYIATQAQVPIVPVVGANYRHIYDSEIFFFGYSTIKIRDEWLLVI